MSLGFEATVNLRAGTPISLAIHPARQFPKFPLGTQKSISSPIFTAPIRAIER